MSQSIPAGSRTPTSAPRAGLRVGTTGFAIMIVVLLVAVVFAANANDLIGWLVVAVAAGWLIFAIVAYVQVRNSVRSAARKVDSTVEGMRADAAALRSGRGGQQTGAPAAAAPAADPVRDTKLDHSFKIVQVQARVIQEQLAAADGGDREVVDRALETITITSSNARDMIKGTRDEGPVSGTVVD